MFTETQRPMRLADATKLHRKLTATLRYGALHTLHDVLTEFRITVGIIHR